MAPPALGAVLSGEAGPGGVRIALRSPPLRAAVRRAVARLVDPDAVLRRVRLDRVKLKPGRKLSAWGRATVLDAGGHVAEVALALTWVPPSASLPRVATCPEDGIGGVLRGWHAVDEASGMELLMSPFDPAAPELAELLGPGVVAGRPRVTTIRYRPLQRHVVRFDAEASQRDPRWLKLVPGRDAATAMATATAVADGLAGRGPAAAVRPLGRLAGSAVLYPSAPGRPLRSLCRPGRPWPAEALRRCGAALRQVHELPPAAVPFPRTATVEEELAGVARAGEHLAALDPAAAGALDAVLDAAGTALAGVVEAVPAHGDCKLDHFWLDHDTVTFIDVDSAAVADPARDLGKLLADLRWWTAPAGGLNLDGGQAAVATGYDAPERWARATAWEALLLAKAVVRRTSLLDEAWTARTQGGLRQALALLDASPTGRVPVPVRT